MKEIIVEFYDILRLDRERSPWSKNTTFKDRVHILSDEIEEIKQALEMDDLENLRDEIGDALWGVLYLMIIAEENGMFTGKDVIQSSLSKIKRRKPWIFSGEELDMQEEMRRWQKFKDEEKD